MKHDDSPKNDPEANDCSPEEDLEVIGDIKGMLKKLDPFLKDMGEEAKGTINQIRFLETLLDETADQRRIEISLKNAFADAQELSKEYDAGSIAPEDAHDTVTKLAKEALDLLDEWLEIDEKARTRNKFQRVMENKKRKGKYSRHKRSRISEE